MEKDQVGNLNAQSVIVSNIPVTKETGVSVVLGEAVTSRWISLASRSMLSITTELDKCVSSLYYHRVKCYKLKT